MGNKNNSNNNNNDQNIDDNKDNNDDGILLSPQHKYMYAKRRCFYRTEQLEISPDELSQIKELQTNNVLNYNPYNSIMSLQKPNEAMKIIIDTDIGTDIDDVLTLLLVSHISITDIDVIGITTNYRPTILRKHIAECILRQTSNNDIDLSSIPIIAGSCYLMGTHRPFYYAGNEGKGLGLNENDNNLMKYYWNNLNNSNAEDFIYKNLLKYPKQITIISIGIPTNIGNLIYKYGRNKIESLCGHIVVMGGGSIMKENNGNSIACYTGNDPTKWKNKLTNNNVYNKHPFKLPQDNNEAIEWITNSNIYNPIHLYPNHNISGDTLASKLMFSLNCPISLIPHHITSQNILSGKPIETLLLLATKSDINKQIYEDNENGICGVLMREWFRVRRGQRSQCLHDPLTLYEAIYITKQSNINTNTSDFQLEKESCLKYCNGTIICHEWAAFITFIPNKNGPHRFAYECINPKKFVKWCGDTMIKNVSPNNITTNAGNYKTILNTYATK